MIVHVFGRTDVGRTREHNEDAFVVADLTRGNATLQPEVRTHTVGDRGSLFMVADGMGGAAAGEIASAMAIEVVLRELTESLSSADAPDSPSYALELRRATSAANSAIHQFAGEHPEYRGMGTTATIAAILGDTLYLAQVGDSRGYLVRDGHAKQITKDQSLMQKLIEAGEITEEEAEHSERRNIILQALGPEANIKVDLTYQKLCTGDTLVLCSDGLSGQVRTEEIGRVVSSEADLMQVCKKLIDKANEAGGPDNITVIAAKFDGDGLVAAGQNDSVGHKPFPFPNDSTETPAASRPTIPQLAETLRMDRQVRVADADREPQRISKKVPIPPEVVANTPMAFIRKSGPNLVQRKFRGSLIALGLVILGLVVAMYWVYHTASSVISNRQQQQTTTSP